MKLLTCHLYLKLLVILVYITSSLVSSALYPRPVWITCIYLSEISRIVASGILVYGPSDHLPVFAVCQEQFIKPKRSHTIIQYRDYKHLKENSSREDLQQLSFNDIIPELNGSVKASLEKWYSLFSSKQASSPASKACQKTPSVSLVFRTVTRCY